MLKNFQPEHTSLMNITTPKMVHTVGINTPVSVPTGSEFIKKM